MTKYRYWVDRDVVRGKPPDSREPCALVEDEQCVRQAGLVMSRIRPIEVERCSGPLKGLRIPRTQQHNFSQTQPQFQQLLLLRLRSVIQRSNRTARTSYKKKALGRIVAISKNRRSS